MNFRTTASINTNICFQQFNILKNSNRCVKFQGRHKWQNRFFYSLCEVHKAITTLYIVIQISQNLTVEELTNLHKIPISKIGHIIIYSTPKFKGAKNRRERNELREGEGTWARDQDRKEIQKNYSWRAISCKRCLRNENLRGEGGRMERRKGKNKVKVPWIQNTPPFLF